MLYYVSPSILIYLGSDQYVGKATHKTWQNFMPNYTRKKYLAFLWELLFIGVI